MQYAWIRGPNTSGIEYLADTADGFQRPAGFRRHGRGCARRALAETMIASLGVDPQERSGELLLPAPDGGHTQDPIGREVANSDRRGSIWARR